MDPLYFFSTQPTKGCDIFYLSKGAAMAILWIIISLLFMYSVYMTFWGTRTKHPAEPIHGSLEIADGEDGEAPYVFMQINTPPNQFKTGDVVCLYVHRIDPRK